MNIDDFETIDGGANAPVVYQADVAVQSSAKNNEAIGSVVFVVNWFEG